MSIRTIYRAIVMIATGVIVVQGWQLYGPSKEKVKSMAVEAFELAQTAWNRAQQNCSDSTAAAADPRPTAETIAAAQPTAAADISPPSLAATPSVSLATENQPADRTAIPNANAPAATTDNMASLEATEADRLPPLLSRLQEIGGADPKLAPWGSSGELYRFCCRARMDNMPALSRHFEAVAAEPVAAVEQVIAKVEAWRTAQHEQALPR
jgi:hypothetical protein